ncbi:MAG: tetratricopeptide repeat protein [Silvanigrellaceae bacterium]
MQKNKRLIPCLGLAALLMATLEDEAKAKQNPAKVQSAMESKATIASNTDPIAAMNSWQGVAAPRMLQSRTTQIQTGGLSAIESLKQQTSQFTRSLRTSSVISEGRFEAPGLFDFASFMRRSDDQLGKQSTREEEIESLRFATIQSIEKILRQPSSPNQRIDLLLRLAELHSERHTYFLIREMNQYEAAHTKWLNNHRSGPEPKISQVQSMQSLNAATQILRNVVNQFPNHSRTPDALYQLGFLLTEMKSESAAPYFQRLIDRFPKSNFIPDANLALGEFYFSRNKFNDAQTYYQKVLNFRTHRAYPYAVYKLGWTFFNIRGSDEETAKNLQKSLTAFKLLEKFIQEGGSGKKLAMLRKDALRDMVLVYAELGDIDEAQKYFKSMNETGLYASLLERLAWLHTDGGRHREAIEIYSRLLKEFPASEKNPQFLVRLAALFEKDNLREQMVESLQQLSDMASPESQWWKSQPTAKERENSKRLLTSEANLWSLRFHSEFQKSKNKATARQALALYEITLRHQAESMEMFSTLFNKSQLHTTLEEHEKAIDGYARVAWIDKKLGLKRPETKIALENAIAESDILIQRRGTPAGIANGTIPALEARLIKLIDLHASLFPKDSERIALLHRAALIHFQSGQLAPASQRWMSLAKESPQSPFVSEGLRLIIKRSYDSSNWQKASADARTFLSIPGIPAAPVGAQISKLMRVALFQQALQTEKNGMHLDAARQFVSYQKDFPTDPDAGKALVNAANNQFKANRPEEALANLRLFSSTYQTSEYLPRALEMMAMTAEAMARLGDAASAFEQLAARRTNKETFAQEIAHAAELRLADNNPGKAIANAEAAIPHLKRPADVCEMFKLVLDAQMMMRSTATLATAHSAHQRCQNTSPEWGLYFSGQAAQIGLAAGQAGEAAKMAAATLSRGKLFAGKLQSAWAFEGLRLAGQVQLSLLEAQSRQLLSRRVSSGSAIQNEFGSIRTDAQRLAQQYVQLSQSGQVEAAVGALYRVAEIQEGLALILMQAPAPQGSSPAETESFKAKIEKIALPLQEEAAKLYSQALDKASDAEIISQYTHLLKDKLATIRPDDFRKSIEVMPRPSYFAHELPLNNEVKGVVEEN